MTTRVDQGRGQKDWYVRQEHPITKRRPMLAAAVLIAASAGCAAIAATPATPVPDALEVPADQVLVLAARGVGVQIYDCLAAADDPQRFAWTLRAPEAILRSRVGKVLGRHYAGPTWEATDGSQVVGEVVAKLDSPNPASIPWLKLRAKSTSGAGIFAAVVSIQRLRTSGGKAPAEGCGPAQSGAQTRVRYAADYRFYAARP